MKDQHKDFIREKTISFALEVSDICDDIEGCSIFKNQLIRSSSSIGANVHEARYAQSRADFIHKLEIALKEVSETFYWLELLYRKDKISEKTYKEIRRDCSLLRVKIVASITTCKKNSESYVNEDIIEWSPNYSGIE